MESLRPSLDDLCFSRSSAACTAPLVTFDKNMGNFTQDGNDNFNWTRQKGSTGSFGTGPSNDHTIGNSSGKYPVLGVSHFDIASCFLSFKCVVNQTEIERGWGEI